MQTPTPTNHDNEQFISRLNASHASINHIQFIGRLFFAIIGIGYIYWLPIASNIIGPVVLIGLVLVYIAAHALLLFKQWQQKAPSKLWQIEAGFDLALALVILINDPYLVPPSIFPVLLLILTTSLQRPKRFFVLFTIITFILTGTVIGIRHQLLEQSQGYPLLVIMIFMAVFSLYFFVLLERLRKLEKTTTELSDRDIETGLMTVQGLSRAANYLMPLHERSQTPLLIMLADISCQENKELPIKIHHACVERFVSLVHGRVRKSDIVARYNHTQFAFLLFDTQIDKGEILAKDLQKRFNQWSEHEGVTARARIALTPKPNNTITMERALEHLSQSIERTQKNNDTSTHVIHAPAL